MGGENGWNLKLVSGCFIRLLSGGNIECGDGELLSFGREHNDESSVDRVVADGEIRSIFEDQDCWRVRRSTGDVVLNRGVHR